MIKFIPVEEIRDPLSISIGLSGGSGSGKTYSALLLARGLAEGASGETGGPIGYVDTENRRALHYREAFPEMWHYDMQAVDAKGRVIGFGPERWIEVIDAAEAAGVQSLVIDSFSHAWEGVGGVLDLHEQVLTKLTGGDDSKRAQRSQLAWAQVKPRYRRLIDRIVRAKVNMVICTRAKPVMQDPKTRQNARPTKTRRADVPWDVAGDSDLIFEMTAMTILDPSAPGQPVYQIKVADQFKGLFDPAQPLSVEVGREMAAWACGEGQAQKRKAAMDAARAEARKGAEAMNAYWRSLDRDARAMISPIMGELKQIAHDADQAAQQDDNPFAQAAQGADDMETKEAIITKALNAALAVEDVEAAMAVDHVGDLAELSARAPDRLDRLEALAEERRKALV